MSRESFKGAIRNLIIAELGMRATEIKEFIKKQGKWQEIPFIKNANPEDDNVPKTKEEFELYTTELLDILSSLTPR